MSILHTIYIINQNIPLENIDLSDKETNKKYTVQTPTITFPFLTTKSGSISQTNSILYYLASQYKKDLLGNNPFENSKINQWIEFANCEINNYLKNLIYPIFGWKEYDKDLANRDNNKLNEHLIKIENELKNKDYIVNNRLTLADIVLFRYLRFFMMLHFPEGRRKNLIPNITNWFEKIMNTKECIKSYGKTILCKAPVKPHMEKINIRKDKEKEKNKDKGNINNDKKNEKEVKPNNNNSETKTKKEINPLDLLPPSKFNLDEFKRSFLNNKNKAEAIKNFWEQFDPEGYSFWWMEYQNPPQEGKILFRTSNAKNFFLKKLDSFRKYSFAVHGVYGVEGDYKIRGVWMWRGKEIPKEIKENDYYDYMTIRSLDPNSKEDVELINDYWTKLNETDKVQGRFAADCSYFN